MVVIFDPASIWSQLASFWFFCAAIFGDILLIRFSLAAAYVFLLVAASLGYPSWVTGSRGGIALDAIIWCIITGTLHTIALVRLIHDERKIKLFNEDQEALWRFFYRRSGMGRMEFQTVLQHGQFLRKKAGEVILTPGDASRTLCLLIEGIACFQNVFPDPENPDVELEHVDSFYSGSFFDKRLLNIFGLYLGFEPRADGKKKFMAVAKTDCLLFIWSVEELNKMATQYGPAVSQNWRNCTATSLGLEYQWRIQPDLRRVCATGEEESEDFMHGAKSRDFTTPLRSFEQPHQSTALGFFKWLYKSFHPLMPPGVRHNDLPIHGIMARNRVLALKEAQVRYALADEHEDVSVRGTRITSTKDQ